MDQAQIVYAHNTESKRGLATAGIFLLKWILLVPHFFILSGLSMAQGGISMPVVADVAVMAALKSLS